MGKSFAGRNIKCIYWVWILALLPHFTNSQTVRASEFDRSNPTRALQLAINSEADSVIIDNFYNPWVIGPLVYRNVGNKTILFEKGIKVQAMVGAFASPSDALFKFIDCYNVEIIGNDAELSMNKEEYTRGEWRHGIHIGGCKDMVIRDISIMDSGGDGIYIGRSKSRGYSSSIHLSNICSRNNRRQGLSIISVVGLEVSGSQFNSTEGTPPGAGIDFEPNSWKDNLIDINISNSVIEGNQGSGILFALGKLNSKSKPVSIEISNCMVKNNFKGQTGVPAQVVFLSDKLDPVAGNVAIKKCEFIYDSGLFLYSRKSGDSYHVSIEKSLVKATGSHRRYMFFEVPDYEIRSTSGGYHFEDLLMGSSGPMESVLAVQGSKKETLSSLKDVTGFLMVESPHSLPLFQYIWYNPIYNLNVRLEIISGN